MSLPTPSNKRCKTLNPNDYISKLPDDVTSHILSRLPTVEATKTSILSRSWQYKWMSVYDLDFDNGRRRNLVGFINFVIKVLVTCNSKLRSFSLSLSSEIFYFLEGKHHDSRYLDPKYVETWISCVLMRNVEIVKISARKIERLDSQWCFRNWTTLTELELRMNCTLWIPVDSVLPNLKRLLLEGGDRGGIRINREQVSSDGRVIVIFPVLEYLYLGCDWLDVKFVEIHAPELITFESFGLNEPKPYEIKVFGGKLTTFSSRNGFINKFNLDGSPGVSYVELNHSRDNDGDSDSDDDGDSNVGGETWFATRARKILKQLPNVKCLTMSGYLVRILVPSRKDIVFPTFDKLRELHVVPSCYIEDAMELLQLLPQVEFLNIDVDEWDGQHMEEWPWDPEIVYNLKIVELREFSGHGQQLDFLQFVLENAKELKKLSVVVYSEQPANVKTTIDFMSKLLSKPSGCVIEVL